MNITITFQDGRWKTDPNPAIVPVGSRVRWIIRAPKSQFPKLRWLIKFGTVSPFADRHELVIETRYTGLGGDRQGRMRELMHLLEDLDIVEEIMVDHRGASEEVSAENPGDYKYDLRVENAETGEAIGHEDPLLFVLRGPFRVWL